ncbi:hypothetical protein BBJ28_00017921 [Nothophytophthora sp. Chile5]|nr:hypothetical protein BBJ28_00017921 [Nothophytophthora sp. Chile5]
MSVNETSDVSEKAPWEQGLSKGSTLSSACGSVCDSFEPCLTYNVSESTSCNSCKADADGVCNYVCYNIYREDPTDRSLFAFFVTFGDYQSEEELAARAEDPTYDAAVESLPDNTSTYAWASNNIVTRIDPLDLPSATSSVALAGGSTFDYSIKSKVANVDLAPDLLTSQTQVTQVWLMSMNLKGQVAAVRDLLPYTVTYVNLANTLLHTFPTDLLSLPSLTWLYVTVVAEPKHPSQSKTWLTLLFFWPMRRYLNLNYITSVNSSVGSTMITQL